MRTKLCLFLSILCLLLTACTSSGQQAPVSDPAPAPAESTPEVETLLGVELTEDTPERERGWIEDLDWLRRKWEEIHPDPYFHCSEEEFRWRLEQLAARVSELSDSDLYFEVESLVVALDEGRHSGAKLPDSLSGRVFPVLLQFLGDRVYLVSYAEGYEQFAPYLLQEVVAVNGVDMAYIQRKFERFIDPNNAWASKEYFMNFSAFPAFYDWVGCDYKEGYTFQILNGNQEVVDVEVPVLPLEEYSVFAEDYPWIWPENWDRLAYMKGGNWAEYFEGENSGCIYVSFYEFDPSLLEPLPVKAAEVVSAHPECRKLVIDLRWNPGGDAVFLKYFKENMKALYAPTIEQTYVVVGGYSTSASTVAASFFKSEMDAVIVGEPMGQFSSFYARKGGSCPQILLPYSQIQVGVADLWREWEETVNAINGYMPSDTSINWVPLAEAYYDEDGRLYDWECMVLPDVYVYQDIEDIRQGKDSVLEWILEQ